jgi:anti-sigma factor RsiW
MQELWQRVSRVLETCNKEFAKWERYCREQGDLLRALEDLAAQERTMYELDNRKDHIMTVCKLALANLAMWVRDVRRVGAYGILAKDKGG